PSPSSEESGANLIFGEPRRRGSRLRDLRRSARLGSRPSQGPRPEPNPRSRAEGPGEVLPRPGGSCDPSPLGPPPLVRAPNPAVSASLSPAVAHIASAAEATARTPQLPFCRKVTG